MRNFLLGVLLLPAGAMSQQPVTVDKPVICDRTEVIIKGLINSEYKEKPIWIGVDDNSKWSIFANEKTKTWTLIQFDGQIACVIGMGKLSRLVFTGPEI